MALPTLRQMAGAALVRSSIADPRRRLAAQALLAKNRKTANTKTSSNLHGKVQMSLEDQDKETPDVELVLFPAELSAAVTELIEREDEQELSSFVDKTVELTRIIANADVQKELDKVAAAAADEEDTLANCAAKYYMFLVTKLLEKPSKLLNPAAATSNQPLKYAISMTPEQANAVIQYYAEVSESAKDAQGTIIEPQDMSTDSDDIVAEEAKKKSEQLMDFAKEHKLLLAAVAIVILYWSLKPKKKNQD